MGTFATVINCMDGRVQKCVNDLIKETYTIDYPDTITFAGPVKVIALNEQEGLIDNLKFRVDISVNNHGSKIIAVAGHHDCAGVTESDDVQLEYIKQAAKIIKEWYPNTKVIAVWVNESFEANQIKYN